MIAHLCHIDVTAHTLLAYQSAWKSSKSEKFKLVSPVTHTLDQPTWKRYIISHENCPCRSSSHEVSRLAARNRKIEESNSSPQIGRAHVCTPVTNAQPVCRLLLDKTKHTDHN